MSLQRSLTLLALVSLIGVALWWLVGGGGDRKTTAPVDQADLAVTGGAPAAGPPITASQASRDQLTRADAQVYADPGAEPPRTCSIRVLFAQDGRPAAGAEVLLAAPSHGSLLPESEWDAYNQANADERLDRWGSVFPCDERGVARIPVPGGGKFSVAARAGEFWGRRDLRAEEAAGDSELVIELKPAIHLRVLVLDERQQAAAGVPVAYRALRFGRGADSALALTGADGIATLRHLQEECARNSGRAYEHVVAIGLPLEPAAQASFNPRAPPADPIVLTLPGTGTVEIEVIDLAGRPGDRLWVGLQKQMSEENRQEYRETKGMIGQHTLGLTWQLATAGVARFERVGLGLTLEFAADFGSTGTTESGTGLGPARPGETVRHVLRQTETVLVLTGRLVDVRNQPLPSLSLTGEICPEGSDGSLASVVVESDAEGSFRFPVPLDPEDAAGKILIAQAQRRGLVMIAVADLPATLAPGENDLGELVLGKSLLVSGVVLTPDGAPASAANGTIEPAGEMTATGHHGLGHFGEISWEADEKGRFEVHGDLSPGPYRITAWVRAERQWRCDPRKFDFGARDLELRFLLPPGVRGRILLDPGINRQDVGVMLANEAGTGGMSALSPDSGEFVALVFREPGIYDIEVRHAVAHNVLWVQRGLSLTGSGTIDVGDIDLRGLPRTRITVLDPEGKPVPEAGMGMPDLGSYGGMFRRVSLPVSVPHSPDQHSALFEVPGFARLEVALNGGEQTARLTPGIRISLALDGLPPQPAGWGWQVTLYQMRDAVGAFSTNVAQSLEPGNGTAEYVLPTTGSWQVLLDYRSDPNTHWDSLYDALGDPPPVIEVRPAGERQEFRLAVDAEAIARALGER